ncbi:hypothetical protein [Novosphingobium sp.]|uniref:hypothetical protein n=1 Tax=Novosphingobium sp. TaxID=1874826 RepID=UPI0038BD776E
MKRLIPPTSLLTFALLALGLAVTPGQAQPTGRSGRDAAGSTITPAGNPSALIAAEIAFARAAQDRGQWAAFDAFAAEEAQLFVPQRTLAKPWLRKQANPAQAVKWQVQQAWISCDGTAGVTFGAYQGAGDANGWFSTVWQRQRKKGNYLWLLDQGDALSTPLPSVDWIEGKVADCPPHHHAQMPDESAQPPARKPAGGKSPPPPLPPLPGPVPAAQAVAGADTSDGRSDDGSLVWRTSVAADGARDTHVWLWKDGTMSEVLHRTAAAPNPAHGG